jgi:hypothetical protein
MVMTMTLLASLVSGARTVGAEPPVAWQGFANAWIASHAQRLHGTAPKDTRKSCEGDVNGDGHADVVVIYSIEGVGGGNDWTQYATVLTSTPQGYGASLPREVGGKSVRAVDGCTIAGTTVELDLKTYGPKDGSCCPSVPGKAHFAFQKGALIDAPAAVAAPAPAGMAAPAPTPAASGK